jgi:hypothetical protein
VGATVRFEAFGAVLSGYVNDDLAAQAVSDLYAFGAAGLRHHSASAQNLTSRYDLFRWHY